jgi:DivIVA domain-containing protein
VAVFELHDPSVSAGAITGRRFRSARRGYDPVEVDAFLAAIADRFVELQQEVEQQRSRAELFGRQVAGAQEGAYARVFRRLMDVMRAADDAAAQIRAQAERDARDLVVRAQAEADRIVAGAWARAAAPGAAAEKEGPPRDPDDPPPPEEWWAMSRGHEATEPVAED